LGAEHLAAGGNFEPLRYCLPRFTASNRLRHRARKIPGASTITTGFSGDVSPGLDSQNTPKLLRRNDEFRMTNDLVLAIGHWSFVTRYPSFVIAAKGRCWKIDPWRTRTQKNRTSSS
jgi:hypothetical protein